MLERRNDHNSEAGISNNGLKDTVRWVRDSLEKSFGGMVMGIFDHINFNNLPKGFNESSVREEIVVPILNLLGYSAFDEQNCVIRELQ